MHERFGSNNEGEIVLRRLKHTPNLSITTVYDEPTENELGYDIKWPAKQPRSLTSPAGTELTLIMSSKKLGWLKVRPVTDEVRMAKLLNEFMRTGTTAIKVAAGSKEGEMQDNANAAADTLNQVTVLPGTATPTNMNRKPKLTGVELLRKQHVIDGHAGLSRTIQTMAISPAFKKGVITKADIEQFVREGCGACESAKMKRRPFGRNLTDVSKSHPGKRWVGDHGG